MRDATNTSFVLRPSRHVRALLAGWAGVCVGAGAAGLSMQAMLAAGADDPVPLAVGIALLAASLTAVIAWRAGPANSWQLEWQGQSCHLSLLGSTASACEGQVRPMIDLGGWLLLRFRATDGRCERWLTASARHLGPDWHRMRAALFRPDGSLAAWQRG